MKKLFNKSGKTVNKKNLPGSLLAHTLATERQREGSKKEDRNGQEEREEGQDREESQNLQTAEVRVELWRSSSASPYSKLSQLQQMAHDCAQSSSEKL